MKIYHQIKFDNKMISSSEDIIETVMIIWTLAVTLTLKIANQPFYTTLWLMMRHHNTKFGNKMFADLENIIWTNIDILTLCCDLGLDRSNPIFFFFREHSGLWCCITTPNLVTKCSVVQKITSGQTFTDVLNHCCDLDLECSNPFFSQDTLAYDAVLSNLSLVANGQAVSKIK